MTLLCVCEVDSFIPELEHLMKKLFHGLFSKKNPLKSESLILIYDMKLRSTSSAEQNFADEITWITWKTEQNLEIWPFFTPVAGLNLLPEKVSDSLNFPKLSLFDFRFAVFFPLAVEWIQESPIFSFFKPWKEKPPKKPGAATWAVKVSM